jgi:hypothetical protein
MFTCCHSDLNFTICIDKTEGADKIVLSLLRELIMNKHREMDTKSILAAFGANYRYKKSGHLVAGSDVVWLGQGDLLMIDGDKYRVVSNKNGVITICPADEYNQPEPKTKKSKPIKPLTPARQFTEFGRNKVRIKN